MTASVTFDTTVTPAGNNTGIVVPDDVIERLGAGRRPAVVVTVNGYEYQSTVGVMGGRHLISISAAVRKDTGLKAGDPIHVILTLADRPRDITVPADLAAALSADPSPEAFFAKLSNSLQRTQADNANPPRPPRPGNAESTRLSPCSERESNGEPEPGSL